MQPEDMWETVQVLPGDSWRAAYVVVDEPDEIFCKDVLAIVIQRWFDGKAWRRVLLGTDGTELESMGFLGLFRRGEPLPDEIDSRARYVAKRWHEEVRQAAMAR